MIDTMNAQASEAQLYPAWLAELRKGNLQDWRLIRDGETRVGNRMEHRTVASHGPTTLRVTCLRDRIDRIEVSVPRLLMLDPGIQCRTQIDFERRLTRLAELLDSVGPGMAGRHLTVTRLDLALTLDIDPDYVLALHRLAKHKRIRRETALYYNPRQGRNLSGPVPFIEDALNSVVFNGTHTRISLYNKVAQVCKHKREVPEIRTGLRAEVQLKGAARIAGLFGKRDKEPVLVADLTLAKCYQAFRSILVEFDPVAAVPAFQFDLAHLIAILERHPSSWADLGGCRPLDAYRLSNGVGDRQFQKMRADVAKASLTLKRFLWQEVLPFDRLPSLVDILEGGIPQRFPATGPLL